MFILDNGGHIGDLVEEVKLSLVEVFGRAGQRASDLLHHLLQQLTYVSCTEREDQSISHLYVRRLFCGVMCMCWVRKR